MFERKKREKEGRRKKEEGKKKKRSSAMETICKETIVRMLVWKFVYFYGTLVELWFEIVWKYLFKLG